VGYDGIASEYDAAFAWESDPGVILPVWDHLGRPSRVIEFACGPARLLSTLVAKGTFGVGVDVSRPMIDLAREHLQVMGGEFALHQARLEDFEVDPACGGAFCAVGSFGHLHTRDTALAHLKKARKSLTEGGRYAIQLSLKPLVRTEPQVPNETMGWEFGLNGETLRYTWYGTGVDPVARQEVQRSRIEWLTGSRQGEIIENDHVMAIWDWESWSELIRMAGFTQVAALDTKQSFHELPLGLELHEHPQSWHILAMD
jgi:SAM-dependent methyltransferase